MSYADRQEEAARAKIFSQKVLEPRFLGVVLWMLLFGALILLVLWGYIAFFQPAQNVQVTDYPILLSNSRELRVRYLNFILATDNPSTVEITFYKSEPALPTDVIVSVPVNLLAIYDAGVKLKVKETTVHFADTNALVEHQSIQVVNLKTTRAIFSEESFIEFQVSGHGISPEVVNIPVKVEGIYRAALRDLEERQVGERSPLFLLVTALISGIGLVYREHLQQQQKREKDEKERATSLLEQIKKSLISQDLSSARFAFDAILREGVERYLSHVNVKQAEALLNLAEGEKENIPLGEFSDIWPNETAAALAYACLQNPKDPSSLRLALRQFPKDKISLDSVRDDFQRASNTLGAARPSHARVWPLLLNKFSAFPYLRENLKNPFPSCATAEEESQWLFTKKSALFWEYPLYEKFTKFPKLQEGMRLFAIHGEPGSGKTALALALGRYLCETHILGAYLRGQPTIPFIQRAFASQMWEYIKQNPTYLNLFGPSERALFAAILTHSLDRAIVLAKIGQAISKKQELKGDSDAKSRQEEEIVPLRLLNQAIESKQPKSLSAEMWPQALFECAKLLNFEQIRLVIDTTESIQTDWLEAVILAPQQDWNFININLFLFLPLSEVERTQIIPVPLAEPHLLTWDESMLERMLTHRWETANGSIPALDTYFRKGALKVLLQSAQNNPRYLSQLWNCLPWSSTERPISKSDVLAAIEKCP